MIIGDYRGSFEERMDTLEKLLANKMSIVLVGSSFGGLMGTVFAIRYPTRVKKLILLAPALSFQEFRTPGNTQIQVPAIIFHGTMDQVVPMEPVRKVAQEVFADLTFEVVEDDHFLTRTFSVLNWEDLLTNQENRPFSNGKAP